MPRGRPFAKGHKKLGGRPPGQPNKVTRAVKDFLREITEDPEVQESFRKALIARDRGALQAFLGTVHMVVGKPKESVEVSTSPSMSKLLLLALQAKNEQAKGEAKKT